MKIFKLPDLGEGLPDAIIREWHVKPGDHIESDQNMVAMETAKALVDVPAPFSGTVEKLFGEVGDTVETGNPLVGFAGEAGPETTREDSGTVVGAIPQSNQVLQEAAAGVARQTNENRNNVKASPAVRALAKRLGVDLTRLATTGERITAAQVEQAANSTTQSAKKALPDGFVILPPARRAMGQSMAQSHQQIVPVTLSDDADIHAWEAQQDFTVRMLRAIQAACQAEPMLNAHFDGELLAVKQWPTVSIALAVDTQHGLYVPVLKDIASKTDAELRQQINAFKQQAENKTIAKEDLHGATIMLSNFGSLAGRYANPIIVPPMVAIVGAGRSRQEPVAWQDKVEIHTVLPLSLTIDHRAVTGGEASRFLRCLIDECQKAHL